MSVGTTHTNTNRRKSSRAHRANAELTSRARSEAAREDRLNHAAALLARVGPALARGQVASAERDAVRSRAIFARHVGAAHPDTTSALDALAAVRAAQGRQRAAIALLRLAVARLATHGLDPVALPYRLHAMRRLARANMDAGRFAASWKLYEETLTLARRSTPRSLVVAALLSDLATVGKYWGRIGDALRLAAQAQRIAESLGAEGDALRAGMLHLRGALEHARQNLARAEELSRAALELREALPDDAVPCVTEYRAGLAAMLAERGAIAQAEPMLRAALREFRRIERGDGHETSVVAQNLAMIWMKQGRLAAAARMQARAVAAARRVSGPGHPDLVAPLIGQALILRGQGCLAEARDALAEAQRIARARLSRAHPHNDQLAYMATLLSTTPAGRAAREAGRSRR